MIKSLPSLAVD